VSTQPPTMNEVSFRPRRYPFPDRPRGWYALSWSHELPPGTLKTGTWFAQDLALWRTASGRLVVSSAYCPHLGAHFGHGGCVEGEQLRCPFHDFRFGADGRCEQTPYGKPPPAAHLRTWTVREINGLILVWWDPAGRPPDFAIPALDVEDWTTPRVHRWRLRSHPQETTENAVDVGHFPGVHGYHDLRVLRPLTTDGAHMNVHYGVTRSGAILGRPWRTVAIDFDIHVHGLGYSQVNAAIPELGLRTRTFVLATPTDDEHIDLSIGISVERQRRGSISPLLLLLPRTLAWELIARAALLTYRNEVSQDIAIWENKAYTHPPALADGDGPVGRYRAWAGQFYREHGSQPCV